MAPNLDSERFHSGANRCAAYLKTPEGRLSLDLTMANLREFLPHGMRSSQALDLGCGTGSVGVPRLGTRALRIMIFTASTSSHLLGARHARLGVD